MIELKDFPIYDEIDLRQVSLPVVSNKEILGLNMVLERNFPRTGGYAVTCVQVGLLKRAFLARFPNSQELTLVCNPEIIYKEEEFLMRNEGCLSFPKQYKDTIRYNRVKVKYLDNYWEERIVIAEGIEAVIFQHEIDHFDGILWKDRVAKPVVVDKKQGRNELCNCGSGKKFKKCHGG